MKKLLIAAAILAIGSPAFAQSYDPEVGSGNIAGAFSAPRPYAAPRVYAAPRIYQGAEGAFAQVIPGTRGRRQAAPVYQAPNVVIGNDGHVLGADPDPNIRFQLRREGDSIEGF
jgi:hypothetical protein